MTVQISIALDLDVYRALVVQADRCDTQVHKLVSAAITASVRGEGRRTTVLSQRRARGEAIRARRAARVKRVAELHAKGMNDYEIAEVVGIHQTTVSQIRRSLSLEPHRHHRRAGS